MPTRKGREAGGRRLDLTPSLHRYPLEWLGEAYELFGEYRDWVLEVAMTF